MFGHPEDAHPAEAHSLLGSSDAERSHATASKSTHARWAKFAGAFTLGVGGVVLLARSVSGPTTATHGTMAFARYAEHHQKATAKATQSTPLDLDAQGDYGVVDASHYPWVSGRKIVEPYKTSTLSLLNLDAEVEAKASDFVWTISMEDVGEDLSGAVTIHTTGNKLRHEFQSPATYRVDADVLDSNGVALASFSGETICRYVKRELRTLTGADRDAFTAAASELWNQNSTSGKALYGPSFTSIGEFVLEHAFSSSGDVNCDHWHEGTGFMAHHFALTVAFEESVRAVDPSVTIPYWDFTIEGEQIDQANGGPSMLESVSPVFSEDWFGSVDENYHIVDSKWAHSKVVMLSDVTDMVHGRTTKHLTNSYGVVTAPWNNNNDAELARVMSSVCGQEPTNKPIPTCESHQMLANLTDLNTLMELLPGVGHGPMHVNTGGVFGECEDQFSNFYSKFHSYLSQNVTIGPSETVEDNLDPTTKEVFSQFEIPEETDDDRAKHVDYTVYTKKELFREKMHLEFFHMYRMLWRSQTCAKDGQPLHLECPESCGLGTDQTECLCTCSGALDDDGSPAADFDWKNIEPCLYASNKTSELMHTILSEDMREEMTRMVCTAGAKEGQQLESASPLDIIFWMIHPILDRLVTAKRLVTAGATIPFGTGMGHVAGLASEDWVEYSYYNTDSYKCPGHGRNDLVLSGIPMLQWIERQVPGGNDNMTNWQFYQATNPATFESVDYIYDNFAWDHCAAR